MVVGDEPLRRVHAQEVRAEEDISGGVTMLEDEEVLAISS